MKKFFANILVVFYVLFYFVASGMADELYSIQYSTKANVSQTVLDTYKAAGYTIKSNDPVYGTKGAIEAASVVQQTNSGLYYYYQSVNDATLNKTILNNIKNSGWSYKKVSDSTLKSAFASQVTSLKTSLANGAKVYNFDDSAINLNSKSLNSASSTPDSLTGYVAQIPSGSTFDVYLQSSVNTANAAKGDEVVAILTKNWEYNGRVIAGQGSQLIGYITKANSAGMAYRNGYVKINFSQLKTVEGKDYAVKTEDIEFKVDSTGKVGNAAGKVVAGAAVGALTGLLIGALSDSKSYGKSTAISAGAGAIIGLGAAALEQGVDAEIPSYTEMVIKLTSPLNVVLAD